MIRLLLVDDHAIFRSGLRRLLADEGDLAVAGEAKSSDTALAFLRQNSVDAVLLDINMPGTSGVETLQVIRKAWPALPVLMLSMYREKVYAQHALQAGAQGYVNKDCEPDDLLGAIRAIANGSNWFAGVLDDSDFHLPMSAPIHTKLSSREHEIFSLIVRGTSLTRIATGMNISVKTVATHRRRVLDKLELSSNAEMIAYALCHQVGIAEDKK